MSSIATLACGNCVYYAMWYKFPPTASWVLIIPGWFLVLSLIRTWADTKLPAIPSIYIALPLVLVVFVLTPGMVGPPLGFWIPVCCMIGTYAGITKHWKTPLATTLIIALVCASVSLVAFGAYNYQQYNQMPAAEREKFLPRWEAIENRKNEAG